MQKWHHVFVTLDTDLTRFISSIWNGTKLEPRSELATRIRVLESGWILAAFMNDRLQCGFRWSWNNWSRGGAAVFCVAREIAKYPRFV